MKTSDEYADINLGACIIKKSTSVTSNLIARYGILVLILAIGSVFLLLLLLLANKITVPVQSIVGEVWAFLTAINPLVYFVLLVALPIPVYSTIWCILHRRKMREMKIRDETPICPIEVAEKKEA